MPPTIMTIMGPTQPSLPPPLCAASAAASMAALCFDFCSVCSPHFSSFLSLCSPFFPPSSTFSSVACSCSACSFCSSSFLVFFCCCCCLGKNKSSQNGSGDFMCLFVCKFASISFLPFNFHNFHRWTESHFFPMTLDKSFGARFFGREESG